MNYIDQGSSVGQMTFARKPNKKTSLFYQQAQKVKEEEQYIRDVNELPIFKEVQELEPYKGHFQLRTDKFFQTIEQIIKTESSLLEFAKGYTRLGFQISDSGITYREFAPAAKKFYLYGEFNNENKKQHECEQVNGLWELFLASGQIQPNQAVRIHLQDINDKWVDRKPIWANSSKICEKEQEATLWFPDYAWKSKTRQRPLNLRVSQYDCKLSYNEYMIDQIPKVAYQGYNSILIKHQNLEFLNAPDPKLGTPKQLQELIDTAHSYNLYVILELQHTNYTFPDLYDGTEIYGRDGRFDYSKWEVLRLLLSNIEQWVRAYNIDGFVLKNVSQIIYGGDQVIKKSSKLEQYFGENICMDGLIYLMLVTDLLNQISDNIVIIADDDSGYPFLCRPIREGGIGFDLTLSDVCFIIQPSMEQIPEEEVKL